MKAKEIIFTSEPITAKEAERICLVNRVVPADKLEEAVDELAERIIKNSQASIKVLKKTMNRGMKLDLGAALELEASEHSRARAVSMEERRERVKTFLKRGKT